ncbi:hypothetical protein IHE45_17G054800 [Dioscorea alata]|uniref:Uncharacterized protein n=1 Tax=Dioscorea alata TaxID=55571 RepID=A0ACB7UCA7_DIOAL|nr:hypothetical protein IHE45_17G054800 [Dioscorea alata]
MTALQLEKLSRAYGQYLPSAGGPAIPNKIELAINERLDVLPLRGLLRLPTPETLKGEFHSRPFRLA